MTAPYTPKQIAAYLEALIADDDEEIAANNAEAARVEGTLNDLLHQKAVCRGVLALHEAHVAAREAGTGDEAQRVEAMLAALRDAREVVGGGDGLDELIAQYEALARKGSAA